MIRTASRVRLGNFDRLALRGFHVSAHFSNEVLEGQGHNQKSDVPARHHLSSRKRLLKKGPKSGKAGGKPGYKRPYHMNKGDNQNEGRSQDNQTFFEKNDGGSKGKGEHRKGEHKNSSNHNNNYSNSNNSNSNHNGNNGKKVTKDSQSGAMKDRETIKQELETRFWPEPKFTHKKVKPLKAPELPLLGDTKMLRHLKVPPSYAFPVNTRDQNNGTVPRKKVPEYLKPEKGVDPKMNLTYNPWDPDMIVGTISDKDVHLEAVEQDGDKPNVLPPTMKHETDTVLFKNSTVQTVRDARTGVYNFPQYVEDIVSTDELDMEAISGFTPPSKDQTLTRLANDTGATYFGSTSTLTPLLAQFHNLLSNFRPANLRSTSKWIEELTSKPTNVYRSPHVAEIHRRGNSFALGVDKVGDYESLLSKLGHSLEAFLTHTPEEYECLKKNPDMSKVTEEQVKEVRGRLDNTYAYSKISKFLTRSQLDCYDPRLPGTGTFDLKTRAVAGTRYDQVEAEMCHGTDYYVYRNVGQYESFEREYFDMARTVALKYSLQARIGRMDGIYVAYHNMKRFFGFQYFPLAVLDQLNHTAAMGEKENLEQDPKLWGAEIAKTHSVDVGCPDYRATRGVNPYVCVVEDAVESRASAIADKEFRLSMELISRVLDHTIGKMTAEEFDKHHQRVVFFADPNQAGRMIICVGSHDADEVAYSNAMSHKFHARLLKTDMQNRQMDKSFKYESWPWKIEEPREYELPEDQTTDIAQIALEEMKKMEDRYSPEDLLDACREMWKKSLKNLQVYELHVKNYVNQELVPLITDSNIHPSPTDETEWNVQYRLVKVSGPEVMLKKTYIKLLERKLRVTLNKRSDLNEEEETDVSEFSKVQRMYNKRGAEKLTEIDAIAEKLGNPVSLGVGKRHWLEYPEKIEEVEEVVEGKANETEEEVKVTETERVLA